MKLSLQEKVRGALTGAVIGAEPGFGRDNAAALAGPVGAEVEE